MTTRPDQGHAFPGTPREAFFARISAALDQPRDTPPPPPDTSAARVTHATEDLVALFAKRAQEAGMLVHRAARAQLVSQIAELLSTLRAQNVAISDCPDSGELRERLVSRGIGLIPSDAPAEPHFTADAGISGIIAAIAETGSLVCASGPGRPRATSLIPPVHIAIVLRSQIVPDLLDYFAHDAAFAFRDSSGVVLITGPSKTADIEGILITGVHGPREVHIFLLAEE